ncbi:MAG TPA: plastocyanin/azurin family copper-binding protein [Solirubrobacterales bacterium]|nr:plastocyanin/azurin family copper-binding protein [Solirubrobacterales bacterium]
MRALLVLASALVLLATSAGAAGAATTVTVGNNFFAPSQKTVAAGTTVRFDWTGGRRHNVTKDSGPGRFFASPTTARSGVNFARRFQRSGTYRLYCTLHPAQMRLKLVVR